MSELPKGWEWTTLGNIAESVKNGIYVSRPGATPDGVPILRINAVRPSELRLDEIRYSGLDVEKLQAQDALLEPGDLLFTRYSGSRDYVGVCATTPERVGPLTYPDKLIRVRTKEVDPNYVMLSFASPSVRSIVESSLRTTAGQIGISGTNLKAVRIPLAPLAEQRRIVGSLETQLSRLDAAAGVLVDGALRKIPQLEISTALKALSTVKYSTERLASLLREPLVNGRSVPTHAGGFPVLRLSALASENIQLAERKGGAWSRAQAVPFLVKAGDYLISRGNGSLSRVGRGSAVLADPGDVAFPDTMIRIRPDESLLALPYLALIWNLPMIRRQIEEKARTTAGIYKINQSVVEKIELPLPSCEDQVRVLQYVDDLSPKIAAAHGSTLSAQARASGLRSSLFSEAFAGRLVPQDPNDEPASVLLERIKVERAAEPKSKRGRRTTKNINQGSLL